MISGKNLYEVLSALVPLYKAMFLAYGSVQWWGLFTPMQCAGINRYVATFAVPVLGFNFMATSNLYEINYKFIAADTLQEVVILLALGVWSMIVSDKPIGGGRFGPEWSITLFSLSSLPNTLIVDIPLLEATYGKTAGFLMVQVIVFQSVIWYNLLLILFEYRAAKILINERFPGSVGEITSIRVDSDVVSLSGIEPLETDADRDVDGRFHVRVRGSPFASSNNNSFRLSSIRSDASRASNLSGVEIYLVQSSPVRSISSFHDAGREPVSGVPINPMFLWSGTQGLAGGSVRKHETEVPRYISGAGGAIGHRMTSSNASAAHEPRSLSMDPTVNGSFGGSDNFVRSHSSSDFDLQRLEEFGSKGRNYLIEKWEERSNYEGSVRGSQKVIDGGEDGEGGGEARLQPSIKHEMPPMIVMMKLTLLLVWRKLIRNPNTYASILGAI
ncbi:auxin efflux carrier component 2-like [Punica granatum]|uniref:Auxin efflux carrier component 2-like n=1 Tax=Punica granatum TaxID=22663 RepID=A0A6P8DIM6_PUNGR|nr:auxin efflux carrier component 2-like [Punica granatum]